MASKEEILKTLLKAIGDGLLTQDEIEVINDLSDKDMMDHGLNLYELHKCREAAKLAHQYWITQGVSFFPEAEGKDIEESEEIAEVPVNEQFEPDGGNESLATREDAEEAWLSYDEEHEDDDLEASGMDPSAGPVDPIGETFKKLDLAINEFKLMANKGNKSSESALSMMRTLKKGLENKITNVISRKALKKINEKLDRLILKEKIYVKSNNL